MEDRFRFLQNFSTQMAEIELPGEFLIPKVNNLGRNLYYQKIKNDETFLRSNFIAKVLLCASKLI